MGDKASAIVLAAGSGSRMNSKIKKQFMLLKGKPVLWYSLFEFEKSDAEQVILVTAEEDIEYCRKNIVEKYNLSKVTDIISGGNERYHSVYNGLSKVKGDIVLIHDGARPLINQNIIEKCIAEAKKSKACVVGVPVKDTIKMVSEGMFIEKTPDRNSLWITQTPQAFDSELIKTAYEKMLNSEIGNITDDAMVVEKYANRKVKFICGDYTNIKITTPEDIKVAEVFLEDTLNIV